MNFILSETNKKFTYLLGLKKVLKTKNKILNLLGTQHNTKIYYETNTKIIYSFRTKTSVIK